LFKKKKKKHGRNGASYIMPEEMTRQKLGFSLFWIPRRTALAKFNPT